MTIIRRDPKNLKTTVKFGGRGLTTFIKYPEDIETKLLNEIDEGKGMNPPKFR